MKAFSQVVTTLFNDRVTPLLDVAFASLTSKLLGWTITHRSLNQGVIKMNHLPWKSALLAVVTISSLFLLSACGGGSSSSGANSSGNGGTTFVRGNVNGFGSTQAMFIQERSTLGIEHLVQLVANGVISKAFAQEKIMNGITVCIEGVCDTTDANGSFELDLTGIDAGTYPITFAYGDLVCTSEIEVVENAIVALSGISISDDCQVRISNIRIVMLEDNESNDDGDEQIANYENANGKVTICHKDKNTLTVGASAVQAHLNHGDTLGACNGAVTDSGGDA